MARQPTTNDAAATAEQAVDGQAKIGEEAAAATESAAKAGLQAVSDAANRSAGQAKEGMDQLAKQRDATIRRSQQSLDAAAGAGGAMMQGAQEISQAWMDLAQDRMQRMAEGMRALTACRTPADLIKAQSELVQGAMEQMIDTNRRVADVSMRVMQEVTGQVTGATKDRPL